MTYILDKYLERQQHFFLTGKVEDLRPLFADVDADVRPSYSQVGTTLVKHEGLHLKQKNSNIFRLYRDTMYISEYFDRVCIKYTPPQVSKYSFNNGRNTSTLPHSCCPG